MPGKTPMSIHLQHAIDLADDINVSAEASEMIGRWIDVDKPNAIKVRYVLMALLDLCTSA